MSRPASNQPATVEECLAGEQGGEVHHGYVAGHVYAMTGASARHALIVGAFFAVLLPRVRELGCQLFANAMKAHIRGSGDEFFYCPDLLLICDPEDRADHYRERSCLIVEALSEATERIGRGKKLYVYTTIPSLRDHLLVKRDRHQVDLYHRVGGDWQHEVHTEGGVHLDCLDTDVALDDIYLDAERG